MSDYSQGAQNAKEFGEAFVTGDIVVGKAAVTTTGTAVTVTQLGSDGLTFVADYVNYANFLADGDGESYVVSTTATTVVFTRNTGAVADEIYYIIGNLE